MHADCSELINGLRQPLRELRSGTADVMKAFSAIAQAASKANALDTKTKDLSSRPCHGDLHGSRPAAMSAGPQLQLFSNLTLPSSYATPRCFPSLQ
jgi:hypothetical protein